jgi:ABC-2 type transport system ATP-binding protein
MSQAAATSDEMMEVARMEPLRPFASDAASLVCSSVTKVFPSTGKGIFDIMLTVGPGTAYALVGANGAGKTTLISVCLGYLVPDQGEARICGIDVLRDSVAAKAKVAYVPEVTRLYPHLSGDQNVQFFEGLMGRKRTSSEIAAVAAQVGFPQERLTDLVGIYSKGMRQKLAIAIGLLKGADLFLLDEPTAGLDPKASLDLARTVRNLCAAGKAVLFSSHDVSSIGITADRVGVLRDGRLVLEESSSSFAARSMTDICELLAYA